MRTHGTMRRLRRMVPLSEAHAAAFAARAWTAVREASFPPEAIASLQPSGVLATTAAE